MRRYYLDIRDNRGLILDDEGVELSSDDAARQEAERSLGDAIREALRQPLQHGEIAMEVRDERGPLLRACCSISVHIDRKG